MIGTIVNSVAIVLGTLIGLALRKGFSEKVSGMVYSVTGFVSLVLGIQMVMKADHVLALALALLFGGLLGTWIDVEGAVFRFGQTLKRRFVKGEDESSFAFAFLNSSVLFCVGAMALVGSFNAGVKGDYSILFTKSVLDGILSVLFASSMGVGVAFSALAVLAYQGCLTLLSVRIAPWVSDVMLSELTGIGGVLVLMIAFNQLNLKKLRTGDFLPALFIMVCFVFLFPYVPFL